MDLGIWHYRLCEGVEQVYHWGWALRFQRTIPSVFSAFMWIDLIRRRSPDFQLQTSTALCVVHTAKGGHAAHTAPVHIHLATWWNKTGDSISGPGLHQPHLRSPLNLRHCTVAEGEHPLAPDLGRGSRRPAGHTHRNISCPGAPARKGGSHSGRRRWDCCSCADGTCACCEGPREQRRII